MAASNNSRTVLIVEDDVHLAYLLGYLAQKEGFTVEQVADGRAASQRLAMAPVPDLVLLDVMLPYTDGFELLSRLRATAGWQHVPVIVLTAKVHEEDAVRALALGADDFLTKPFSPAELIARMRRRLRPRSPAVV
jgi:two-component system, OmpR family, alkaline phosphatase synthesis response regulator PhoP